MIEVLISAILVAVIAIGTFTGFDVSNRATSDQRAHAQADSIAQQWEERMRGALVSNLAALTKSFCVNDQGVEVAESLPCPLTVAGYTGTIFAVETTGKFVSDTSGTSSCSRGASSADYIQTTTTVKWPTLGTRPPVSETSLVTPPISGQLVVQDYNGPNGVPGVNVTAVGPEPTGTSSTLSTGTSGCALFTTLGAGNYTVNGSQPGYVDEDGNPTVKAGTTLTAGSSSVVTFAYDRAGDVKAKFRNSKTSAEAPGDLFTLANPSMKKPRTFGEAGVYSVPPGSIISATTVFPFYFQSAPPPPTHSYAMYAGGCSTNNPAEWVAAYVGTPVDLAPGGHAGPVTLDLPPITLNLTKGIVPVAKATGAITELTTGLPGKVVTPLQGPNCGIKRALASLPEGHLQRPAMPFGRYELCAYANLGTEAKPQWSLYTETFNLEKLEGITLSANLEEAKYKKATVPTC